ncbi:MAG TPA: hypothetical protein VN408_42785, partial [Actinoplanes sp.]|nr:hypothetical protein [Actinoplanes sp.]
MSASSPLLQQRLRARRRVHGYLGTATMAAAIAAGVALHSDTVAVRVAGLVIAVVAVLSLRLAARLLRRSIEREAAVTLTRRVTHPVPLTAREVVGTGFGFGAALLY